MEVEDSFTIFDGYDINFQILAAYDQGRRKEVLVCLERQGSDGVVKGSVKPLEPLLETLDISPAGISEESIDVLKFEKDTLNALFSEKEKEIFEKYSVTEKEYRESYSFYFFNPQQLEEIYGELIDSLLLYQQTFKDEKIK